MKKNRIRLTESQLHNVIKQSVKRILSENSANEAPQRLNPDIKRDKKGELTSKGVSQIKGVWPGGKQRTVQGEFLDYSPEQSHFSSSHDWNVSPDYDRQESAMKIDDCLQKLDIARDYARQNGDSKLYHLLNSICGELYGVSCDFKNGNDI